MKPKVSIVVPIFNVEAYLGRCLDSLLSQTMEDIEIIAVNDGSTDASLHILQQYADQDQRIVVINKENGGVSSARNEGIHAAQGDYIGFVDPDDWVDQEMYEAMYSEAMAEKADVVMCTYFREFGTHSKEKVFPLPEKVCYRQEEVQDNMLRRLIGPLKEEIANPEFLDAWGTVWSKLYRADIIRQNGLRFIDLQVIGTNEDSLFNIHAFYHIQKFVFMNKPYYHYWRVNNTSVTSGYKPDLKEKWFSLYDSIESFIADKQLPTEYASALNNRICLNMLGLGLNTISMSNQTSAIMKIRKMDTILKDHRIKQSFKQFDTAYCSMVWKVFYLCAKFRFTIGFYFMLLTIDRLRKMI